MILGFLVFLPGSKHLHIATAPANVWLAKDGPTGRLEPNRIDLELPEEDIRFGVATQKDLSKKQMLDLFSCTECGRCQEACPAWATGKPLSPKLLIMDLRDRVVAEAAGEVELQPLVPNAVIDQVVWDCVTCGACVRECPVDIEHIDTIVDLRRNLVMAESRFPQEAAPMLRGVENQENPWGQPASARLDWAKDLDVRVLQEGDPAPEVLFWVGCAGAFDERAQKTTQSVARLLAAAGIDSAVLGPREQLHRRPGSPDGPRVPVPDARRAERRDAERRRRDEDRRELRALLQHAGERVPGLRRDVRGRAPHAAAVRADRGRAAPAADRRRQDHVPRRLLPRTAQRRVRRASRR